jgi:hypothetical protein
MNPHLALSLVIKGEGNPPLPLRERIEVRGN